MTRLLATCLVLASGTAWGAPSIDDDAKPLIKDLIRTYQGIPGCQVTFERVIATQDEANLVKTQGSILAVKPNRFRVDSGDVTFVSNGETMWLLQPGQDPQDRAAPVNFVEANQFMNRAGRTSIAGPASLVMTLLSADAESLLVTDCKHIKIGPPMGDRRLPSLVMLARDGGSLPEDTKIELALGLHDNKTWVDVMKISPPTGNGHSTVTFANWRKDDQPASAFQPVPGETPRSTPMTASGPTVSPEARVLIDRIRDYYRSIPGAAVTITMQADMPDLPGLEDMERNTLEIVKPNLFKMHDSVPISMACDGEFLWQYSTMAKAWTREKAPQSLGQAQSIIFTTGLVQGLVVDLFVNSIDTSVLFDATKSIDVQPGKNPGEVELVIMPHSTDDPNSIPPTYLGVNKEGPAWLRRIRFDVPEPPPGMPAGPDQMEFVLSDWRTTETPASSFAWTPPADWKETNDLMKDVMVAYGIQEPEMPAHGDSEEGGKPAPEFTLESLEGQSVSLSSLRGKVVILDFWATWCGPCKKGLPVLMDIAKERASDGVVLWSVDMRETPSKVKAFLEKSNWDLPVLMDRKGEVGKLYRVGGIPHTVVIGPDGNIVTVEVGFGGEDATRRTINNAIDQALAKPGT